MEECKHRPLHLLLKPVGLGRMESSQLDHGGRMESPFRLMMLQKGLPRGLHKAEGTVHRRSKRTGRRMLSILVFGGSRRRPNTKVSERR